MSFPDWSLRISEQGVNGHDALLDLDFTVLVMGVMIFQILIDDRGLGVKTDNSRGRRPQFLYHNAWRRKLWR